MNPAQLVAHAHSCGIKINRAQATAIATHFEAGAAEQLTRAGALMDLASALGRKLDLGAAMVHLERSGEDYDLAAERLIDDIRHTRQRVFETEYTRLERDFWTREARARHAVFVGHVEHGGLGTQASLLLLAAEDAGLREPSAATYRSKLERIVQGEISRRYPVRREAGWQVLDTESTHAARLQAVIREEAEATQVVLGACTDLAQLIDALSSKRLKHAIRVTLTQIRKRLESQAAEGWIAQPELYMREVVQAAASAARTA